MPTQLTVSLRDMRFHVRVGILPHEQDVPQPLAIDLSVMVTGSDIVDYRDLYALVRAALEREPLHYLEAIASDISDAALALDRVTAVRVAIRKPHVALPGPLGEAEIVLERTRGTPSDTVRSGTSNA